MPEPLELAGRKVLITGASAGIGAALARAFAEAGAVVGICARREERLQQVLDDCRVHSPESRMWVVDLADLDGIADFAARADAEMGGIDILVNNAGIPKRRHVRELRTDEVEHTMRVNYFSPVRLTLALLGPMEARGGGRIVTVSSVAARLAPPHEGAYAATKAALSSFMEAAEVDMDGTGVHFHLVNPGVFDTELFTMPDNEPTMAPIEMQAPEELAAAVITQLRNGDLEIYLPEWFGPIGADRLRDLSGFIEGTKAFARDQMRGAS